MTSKIYLHHIYLMTGIIFFSISDDSPTSDRRTKLILLNCTQNLQNIWIWKAYIKYNAILHSTIPSHWFCSCFFTSLSHVAKIFEAFFFSQSLVYVLFHSLSFILAKPLLLHTAWRSIFLTTLLNSVQGMPFLSLW